MPTKNTVYPVADTLRLLEPDLSGSTSLPGTEEVGAQNLPCWTNQVRESAPKQILVIDDDPEVLELIAGTVIRAGFQADTARNGEEGWTALCLMPYDLVITGHEMPNLTGLKLIERLRAVSIEPPCILISESLPSPESALRKIVHRGVVLGKPFSPSDLIEKVYGLLLHGDFQEF